MVRLFRHYIPKSLLVLGLFEVLVFAVAMFLGVAVRLGGSAVGIFQDSWTNLLLFALVMVAVMAVMGLYSREAVGEARGLVMRLVLSFAVGLLLMSVIYYVDPDLFLGRGVMAVAGCSAFAGIIIGRVIFLRSANRDFLVRHVLVLGSGGRAARLMELHPRRELRGVKIVGFIPVCGEKPSVPPSRLVGEVEALPALIERFNVDEIVVAVDDRRNCFPTEELLRCKFNGVEVVDLMPFLERHTGKIDVRGLHPSSLIFADGFVQTVVKPASKRIFDLVAAGLLLVLSSPIMLVTALAIWLESGCRGPIFYTQVRVGAGGRHFRMMKFRSMVQNAETAGAQWAEENDPRITRVGRFIRKTRIDELPQLLNVLRAEMSFVGPRPERPEFVEQLSEHIPYYNLRHGVKPGITGWAQVCFPYGASAEDSREKLQYDLYYMKNYSVFLDLMILLETVQVVLFGKGSR